MIGLSVKKTIGIGDAVQFTSAPENYFRATGQKVVDVQSHWVFNHNPYVIRGAPRPVKTYELWNYKPEPSPRQGVYLSLAERYAQIMGVPCVMSRPRLYRFEDNIRYSSRRMILFQTEGVSHGTLPDHIIRHVKEKYQSVDLYQFGLPSMQDIGLPRICPVDVWDCARIISEAKMFIGPDSGPSWIAACYPDVINKIVRAKPSIDVLKNWVPLNASNIHSHWDDRARMVYNLSDSDIGFTWGYRRI